MSYEANFASHHTRDYHVGFLFARNSIRKNKKMFHNFLFSSYHMLISKLKSISDNIMSTHSRLKFQILIK